MHDSDFCNKYVVFPRFLASLQFDGFIDLDSYDTIAMKIKGDGRCYISTVSALSLKFPMPKQNVILGNLEGLNFVYWVVLQVL